MEEWRVDVARGLSIGAALMLLIFAVDVGLVLLVMERRSIHLGTFVVGLALIMSLGLLVLLGYWMYGLADSGYYLDRNALIIHWGANEQVIPTPQIKRVLTGDEVEEPPRCSGAIWPGHYFGHGESDELGTVLFYATAPPREQIFIVTPGLTYGISPVARSEFVEALRRRLEMGPTQAVEPSSRRPGFLDWEIWHNRPALVLLGGALLALLTLTALLCAAFPLLPPQIVLRFDATGASGPIVSRTRIFVIPLIGLLTLAVNSLLGGIARKYERFAGWLVWSGTVLVQVLVWGAALGVLTRIL